MSDPVADFWDKQAGAYTADERARGSYHSEFAAVLDRALTGDVLCVGGLYSNATLSPDRRITVVDVSSEMLRVWGARGVATRVGDARNLPVESASVDHIVFPLILHHVTDGRAIASRHNVVACFREAKRVLRPGGTIWAIEILVNPIVYGAELALAPLTRRLLAMRSIPLVIFHSRRFYESRLASLGFAGVSLSYSTVHSGHWYDLIRPVIGLNLRWPRGWVPVKYGLLRAVKPAIDQEALAARL
jgi:SAM-dependent methyltransferase